MKETLGIGVERLVPKTLSEKQSNQRVKGNAFHLASWPDKKAHADRRLAGALP